MVIGDGVSTAIVVSHSFATRDVEVQVYHAATPWDQVVCDVERTTTGTVTLRFATAPASSSLNVVILG